MNTFPVPRQSFKLSYGPDEGSRRLGRSNEPVAAMGTK